MYEDMIIFFCGLTLLVGQCWWETISLEFWTGGRVLREKSYG